MRNATRKILLRVSPEMAVSLLVHGLLLLGLFLVAGLPGAPEARRQTALVRATPDDSKELVTPPEIPEIPIREPKTPEDPVISETPPPESPLFDVDPEDHTVPDDLTVPPSPSSCIRPDRSVIGLGSRPTAPPVTRPRPRPRATPRPAAPPPPTPAIPEEKDPPDYPRLAVNRELEGRVELLVEVHPDGSVGKIEVKTSSGHQVLDRAAIAAVRKWHFRPAYAQGQPVRSLVEVPIIFRFEQ